MVKSPFDYVTAINDHNHIEADKLYEQYLINRHFSYFIDSIFYAQEASSFKNMNNQVHFDYYFNSLKPKKRFTKWYKSEVIENIKIISEYYDCNYQLASEYIKLLDEEQLKYIREWFKNKKGE